MKFQGHNEVGPSADSEESNLTRLLHSLPSQQEELYRIVYSHLKTIARNRMLGENREGTLQTTDLVNEAYIRLSRQNTTWRDRRHFYGVAAEAMRRILIDAARSRNREKRGGNVAHESLTGISLPACEWETELLELDDALEELQRESSETAEIVRLRFFSGLTCEECARVLEVSVSTVERRWRFARAWLRTRMQENN